MFVVSNHVFHTVFVWSQRVAVNDGEAQLSNLRVPFNNAYINNFPLFQTKRNKCKEQPGNTAHVRGDDNMMHLEPL